MERRKFIAGLGSLTAAGAAGIGTGAFDSVSAERSVSITTVGDSSAYLTLDPTVSQYASQGADGELSINFGRLNPDADTEFFDVFEIKNAGDKEVAIFLDDGNGWAAGSAERPLQGTIYQNLADAGMPRNGWYDEDTDGLGDINGPDAMPSAYRGTTPSGGTGNSNSTNKGWNPATDPHILDPGESMTPDFYIHDSATKGTTVTGNLVVWAFSQEFANSGKGP